jgi:hypothetical protein
VTVLDRIGWSGLAAAVLALIAVGALIWALSLRNDLDESEDELAAMEQTATAEAAGGTVATAYLLAPTPDGPPSANGVLFPSPDRPDSASLNVLGLPTLPEDQVYQLWFLDLDDQGNPAAARPSVTFPVDASGSAAAEVPLPDEPFDAVALTAEPVSAIDDQPNPPVLMIGQPGVAAG